jgi:glycosyltransferase involved in cell wall biosynthesis
MRIGIDGLPLTESLAGIGHYTLELAQHLAVDSRDDLVDVISPRPFLPSITSLQGSNSHLRLTQERLNLITKRWWSIGLPRYLRQSGLDVFHGTNFEIPLQGVCPTVVTIHDLSLFLHPETHERRRVWRARVRLPLMARRATMIITVSDAVSSEVREHFKLPADRVITVHSAARERFRPMEAQRAAEIRKRLHVSTDFILYAGTIEPRKNLQMLVRAFEEYSQGKGKETGLQLVLAGKKGWMINELDKHLRRSPVGRDVLFTGYLNDEELCALYSSCKLFIYPSLYEGFGLPPLEAMACGAPVIASRIPSISEVVGSAARLVSPNSATELAEAMRDLLENGQLRKELGLAGQEHASQYSWSLTAARTREVYRESIARFKRHRER